MRGASGHSDDPSGDWSVHKIARTIVQKHAYLVRFMLAYCSDAASAKDAVGAAILRLLEKHAAGQLHFEAPQPLLSWLKRAALRIAKEQLKKRHRIDVARGEALGSESAKEPEQYLFQGQLPHPQEAMEYSDATNVLASLPDQARVRDVLEDGDSSQPVSPAKRNRKSRTRKQIAAAFKSMGIWSHEAALRSGRAKRPKH